MATLKGGDKLAAALAKIARNANKAAAVDVGFLENATYPTGESVAMVAASQEFGTRTIPARPFFRNMIAAKSEEWPDAVGKLLVANGYDSEKTLAQAGAAIAGQLRQSIVDTNSPPLAESTTRAKGFDKPLVDTGHMLNSIDFKVKDAG